MAQSIKEAGWESTLDSFSDPSIELDSNPIQGAPAMIETRSRSSKRASVKLKPSKGEDKKAKSRSRSTSKKEEKKSKGTNFSFRSKSPKLSESHQVKLSDGSEKYRKKHPKSAAGHLTEDNIPQYSKRSKHSRSSSTVNDGTIGITPMNSSTPSKREARPGRSPESILTGKREKSFTWSPQSNAGQNAETLHIAPPPASGKSNRYSGIYPAPFLQEDSIEVEWLGRIQTLTVDFSMMSFSKLKKEISQMFNIDRPFLRLLYMKMLLKCWDSKTSKPQEITKRNFKDLYFDHIYVIITDVP